MGEWELPGSDEGLGREVSAGGRDCPSPWPPAATVWLKRQNKSAGLSLAPGSSLRAFGGRGTRGSRGPALLSSPGLAVGLESPRGRQGSGRTRTWGLLREDQQDLPRASPGSSWWPPPRCRQPRGGGACPRRRGSAAGRRRGGGRAWRRRGRSRRARGCSRRGSRAGRRAWRRRRGSLAGRRRPRADGRSRPRRSRPVRGGASPRSRLEGGLS